MASSSIAPFQLEEGEYHDVVDFKNASLYLPGLQTLLAVLACSLTSVLACWLLPSHTVSAVRTLTLAIMVGAVCVRKPLRLGKVHGLALVFSALRPAVAVYLGCLVVEQLTHGCASSSEVTPSWRHWVFQSSICAMIFSGFMRARRPLARTDVPFLVTMVATLVVAMLPPPAVALAGPLCEPVSAFGAVERIVRALCFSSCYTVFVYTSTPPTSKTGDIIVCLTRASAASVWTLGATLPLLVLSLPQCALVIWARLQCPNPLLTTTATISHSTTSYGALPTQSPVQNTSTDSHINHSCNNIQTIPESHSPTQALVASAVGSIAHGGCTFGPLTFRDVGGGNGNGGMTRNRMAEIASRLDDEASWNQMELGK